MKLNIKDTLLSYIISWIIFLNGIWLTFAQSETSSSSTSTASKWAPLWWILLMWWICSSQKRKAIGSRLLFYYISTFSSVIGLLLIRILIISNIYNVENILIISAWTILTIIETIFACILLSKKFRNKKNYNILRLIFISQLILSILSILINSINLIENILPVIMSSFWILYFTYSKRVKLVFVENKRDPDILYAQKEEKKLEYNKKQYSKCYKCWYKNEKDTYSCEKCWEIFRQSKEKYDEYTKRQKREE